MLGRRNTKCMSLSQELAWHIWGMVRRPGDWNGVGEVEWGGSHHRRTARGKTLWPRLSSQLLGG